LLSAVAAMLPGEDDDHEAVRAALAIPAHLTTPQDEDVLSRALLSELPDRLRVKTALACARILARPGRGTTRAEQLDFEAELFKFDRRCFLSAPLASWDLAEVCRESLDLEKIADAVCLMLSEGACGKQSEASRELWMVMIDLAEWHTGRGEQAKAKSLGRLARTAPQCDPRVIDRFYAWRFEAEPGVPDEPGLLMPLVSNEPVPMMRPLLGPERHCPCCLGPAECRAHADRAPQLTRPSLTKSLLPGPDEVEEEAEAFNMEVRKVLAKEFKIAGSIVPWDDAQSGSGFFDEGSPTATRVKAAKNMVWSRRFQVRMVDESGANDGVAAEAQHQQDRAEGRRIKARGLPGASEMSSTETEASHESSAAREAESSDDDSDRYFGPLQESVEEAGSNSHGSAAASTA